MKLRNTNKRPARPKTTYSETRVTNTNNHEQHSADGARRDGPASSLPPRTGHARCELVRSPSPGRRVASCSRARACVTGQRLAYARSPTAPAWWVGLGDVTTDCACTRFVRPLRAHPLRRAPLQRRRIDNTRSRTHVSAARPPPLQAARGTVGRTRRSGRAAEPPPSCACIPTGRMHPSG